MPGFVLIGMAQSSRALYAGLALVSIGSGLVLPCMSALVSRYTPEDRQGLALGVFRSNGALARAIGPFAGGLLYWQLGSWAPYYLGAGLLVLPLAMTLTLPPVPDGTQLDAKRTQRTAARLLPIRARLATRPLFRLLLGKSAEVQAEHDP